MTISDFGPLGGDKVSGNRNITDRQKTESREKAGVTAGDQTDSRVTGTEETREFVPVRDMYQTSENRRKISELADQVQSTEDTSRQELVDRARERVASGYYNTPEFLGNLALKIVNTGLAR